jgi:hypothetical protein
LVTRVTRPGDCAYSVYLRSAYTFFGSSFPLRTNSTMFRRGIASNLYELGADEKIVRRILRHAKSPVTKDRYIKAFDPAVVAAMC